MSTHEMHREDGGIDFNRYMWQQHTDRFVLMWRIKVVFTKAKYSFSFSLTWRGGNWSVFQTPNPRMPATNTVELGKFGENGNWNLKLRRGQIFQTQYTKKKWANLHSRVCRRYCWWLWFCESWHLLSSSVHRLPEKILNKTHIFMLALRSEGANRISDT